MLTSLSGSYLIIDDDESLRNLLSVIVESAGAETHLAATPKEALEQLATHKEKIKGALLDLNLEQAKGEDLYDQLIEISPDLDVFPMSGCGREEIEDRLGSKRAAGCIPKPFLSADLIATLANAAKQKTLSSKRV
ncbi:MAG: response regulator [Verrucomicrobiota bacterium]